MSIELVNFTVMQINVTMDTLESATIKDNLLEYLLNRPNKKESIEAFITKFQLDSKPDAVIRSYVEEMEEDGALDSLQISHDRLVLTLKNYGERFLLNDGGYTKKYNDAVLIQQQQEADDELNRTKTKFELKSLRIQTWVSIAALVISVLAIVISIFYD